MTADELLRTMRAALSEERDAIRRLDADGVARATAAKERVLKDLQSALPTDKDPLMSALRELKVELRQNLVLLAHARDAIREAIELCAPPKARPRLSAKL
jgi:hypothetical protein